MSLARQAQDSVGFATLPFAWFSLLLSGFSSLFLAFPCAVRLENGSPRYQNAGIHAYQRIEFWVDKAPKREGKVMKAASHEVCVFPVRGDTHKTPFPEGQVAGWPTPTIVQRYKEDLRHPKSFFMNFSPNLFGPAS